MTFVDKTLFKATPTFRARRKRVLARVQLRGAEGTAQDVIIRDISATGTCAVARTAEPDADEIITVTLPDGSSLWGMARGVDGKARGRV